MILRVSCELYLSTRFSKERTRLSKKEVVTPCPRNVGCWAKTTLKELKQISRGNRWEFDRMASEHFWTDCDVWHIVVLKEKIIWHGFAKVCSPELFTF